MYEISKQLGRGAFGEVYLLHTDRGEKFALKVVDATRFSGSGYQYKKSEAEAQLMLRLSHAHLVQCCTFFMRKERVYLITELCTQGSLREYLNKTTGPVSEEIALLWLGQLADVLRYLHDMKVIHRDVKTDNIFLDDRHNVKLGDLGIARELQFTEEKVQSMIGTPIYMSPEVYSGLPYNSKTDIWSLGCCIHEVLTRKQTFSAESFIGLYQDITQGKIPPMPDFYSEKLRQLMTDILNTNPEKRPDGHEVLHRVCQIQKKAYKSGDYCTLSDIHVDEDLVCRAVGKFIKKLYGGRSSGQSSKLKLEKSKNSDQDEEPLRGSNSQEHFASVEFPTPHPRKQSAPESLDGGLKQSLDPTQSPTSRVSETFRSSLTLSSNNTRTFRATDQSSDFGDETLRPEISSTSMDSGFMDNLAKESIQWLRNKCGSQYGENKTYGHSSDFEASSDSESIVTLYTRAQKVRYNNRKRSGSRTLETSAGHAPLFDDLDPEVKDTAENVIRLTAHQDRTMTQMLLMRIMGMRDFVVHGQTMLDKAS